RVRDPAEETLISSVFQPRLKTHHLTSALGAVDDFVVFARGAGDEWVQVLIITFHREIEVVGEALLDAERIVIGEVAADARRSELGARLLELRGLSEATDPRLEHGGASFAPRSIVFRQEERIASRDARAHVGLA